MKLCSRSLKHTKSIPYPYKLLKYKKKEYVAKNQMLKNQENGLNLQRKCDTI